MKRKLLIIAILVLSIFNITKVNAKVADVSIKNIEMVEKTGNAEIITDATFSGMNINYDIIFKEVNDSIKYKVTIINKGNEDIYINNKGEIGGSNYIVYDYIWDDNQNVIKANSEKTFELAITYKKQVESAVMTNGKYVEAKDLIIRISDQKGNTLPVKNPKTDSNLSIFIILFSLEILMVMAVTIYLIKNKKLNVKNIKQMKKTNMISAGVFLVLVLATVIGYSYCLDSTQIVLNSSVKITKARMARNCSSDTYTIDHPYDNNRTLYEERGDNFPFADEGKTISTGIDENDFCIDWSIIFEKSELNNRAVENMLSLGETEAYALLNNISTMSINSASDVLNVDLVETYGEEIKPQYSIITRDTKEVPDTYKYNNINHELAYKTDISDLQNGEVMLGIYINQDYNSILITIGEDDGVLAPVDSSWMFGFLDRKDIIFQNELNILQGLGPNIDEIKEHEINNLIGIDRILNRSKIQLIFKRNIQISPMVFFSNFELDKMIFSDTNNMSGMFAGSGIFSDNWNLKGLKNWDTASVKDMSGMFLGVGLANIERFMNADDIEELPQKITVEGLEYLNTSNVENMILMFAGAFNGVKSVNISNWDVSKVKDMAGMFLFGLNYVENLDLSKWNVSNVEDLTGTFLGSFNYTNNLNISNWNTSKVKNMVGTFALGLNYVPSFNISNWNTSNVENMSAMFTYALNSVNNFDISNWNTSKVKYTVATFSFAFQNINSFNVKNWDVSNVMRMDAMFMESFNNIKSLDISNWNTSNVLSMSGMFRRSLNSVEEFNISKWNVSKVETMEAMFEESLNSVSKLDLKNWDVSNVETMDMMFEYSLSNASKLDLTNWKVKNNVSTRYMFESIFDNYNDLSKSSMSPQLYINKFDVTKTSDNYGMFAYMPLTIVYVKDEINRDFILSLDGYNRPENWTKDNIIVA